jgi:hypothetical protein
MKNYFSRLFNALLGKDAIPDKPKNHIEELQAKQRKLVKSTTHSIFGTLGVGIAILLAYTNTHMYYNGEISFLSNLSNANHYVDYVSYPLTYGVVHIVGTGISKFKPIGITLSIPAILLLSIVLIRLSKEIKSHKSANNINCHECLDLQHKLIDLQNKNLQKEKENV